MIKVYDPHTQRNLGFALKKDGSVLVEVLEHAGRRLFKRMQPGSAPNEDGPRSLFHYSSHNFRPINNIQPLDSEGLEREFGGVTHYKGIPAMYVNSFPESKAHQAIRNYGSFWAVDSDPANPRAVRVSYDDRVRSNGWEDVVSHVQGTHRFRDAWGATAMQLRYGRPFPQRQRRGRVFKTYSPPSLNKVRSDAKQFTLGTPEANLAAMRAELDQSNMIKVFDPQRRHTLGYVLKEDGGVLVHHLEAEGRLLAKRMFPRYKSNQREYYFTRFDTAGLPAALHGEERGRYYAGMLHYQGTPMIFPESMSDAESRARQALSDHGEFAIVGKPVGESRLVGDVILQNGRVKPIRDLDKHLNEMVQVENEYGTTTKHLKYGPAFDPRRSQGGYFSTRKGWQTPTWNKVWSEAGTVSAGAEQAEIWSRLNREGMLKVTDGHQVFGYALEKAGTLLHHRF